MVNTPKIVEKFLEDFVRNVAQKFPDEIDFILLFGSAARDEWKKNISDVDLIIQVKDRNRKDDVKVHAENVFWELDDKYGTGFRKVCSISKGDGVAESIVKGGQKKVKLYVPFEVLAPGEIDWINGRLRDPLLRFGAELIAPKYLVFLKMRDEGKILYGRDIRKEINPKITWHDRIKALFVPHHLAFVSLLLSPILPDKSTKMSIKANLYSLESVLYYVGAPIGKGTNQAIHDLDGEITSPLINTEHIKRVYKLKYEGRKLGRIEAITFAIRTVFYVIGMNWWGFLHDIKKRVMK